MRPVRVILRDAGGQLSEQVQGLVVGEYPEPVDAVGGRRQLSRHPVQPGRDQRTASRPADGQMKGVRRLPHVVEEDQDPLVPHRGPEASGGLGHVLGVGEANGADGAAS